MFMAGFGMCLLLLVVGVSILKMMGLFSDNKRELAALESKFASDLNSRLFALSEQFNVTLKQYDTMIRNLEQQKPNPFQPYSNEQAIRDIRQAQAEAEWMTADHAPGAGLP